MLLVLTLAQMCLIEKRVFSAFNLKMNEVHNGQNMS